MDGRERAPLAHRRLSRPDVHEALPAFGDCASAGYEFIYSFTAGDAGPHELLGHVMLLLARRNEAEFGIQRIPTFRSLSRRRIDGRSAGERLGLRCQ